MSNELPIGLVVLAIHDSSDVVLDLMKMANYLKLEGLKSLFLVEVGLTASRTRGMPNVAGVFYAEHPPVE
eukprot:1182275-Prorocentrum_minimum.AAC.1